MQRETPRTDRGTMLLLSVSFLFAADTLDATPEALPLARPVRRRLPPDPRGQVDYTAYTLDAGEVRLGAWSVGMGVVPRLQVTTMPALDALEVPNGRARWNLVRAGPIDLSVTGGYATGWGETLDLSLVQAEAAASVVLTPGWSVHGRTTWASGQVRGTPQLDGVAALVERWVGNEIPTRAVSRLEEEVWLDESGTAMMVQLATDLRFNRRDSLVFQAASVLGASEGYAVDPRELLDPEGGRLPVDQLWAASLAYQVSWRNVDLRVGAGYSPVPGAWLAQAVDLSVRFGGETREEERRQLASWRRAQRDAREAVEAELLARIEAR